uniref:Cilia and flagella associated protein 95 n=1 Tax=Latimeria chalumnae TaxID=7897 RepID=M3XGU1_LATCH|nr:PREDICTED: uncharacterized protein C9orf135 homolog [Latimeria chalumnae]|eukprot:XP_014348885.1 PREDICTED: uncharacterized protein C9orf135 homolog [Latimeria chalumnae]
MDLLKPDLLERKGSLALRSNHMMEYSRPTLTFHWNDRREAEPKDYDVKACPLSERNLHLSTYRFLANIIDGDWNTITNDHLSQISLKKNYEVKDVQKPMINEHNFNMVDLSRETGCPKTGFGAVLPSHPPDHFKMHLETTQKAHYGLPYPTVTSAKIPEEIDYSAAYKKCYSQFTDICTSRKSGINTWQDESGIYPNSEIKWKRFKAANPITHCTD